MNDRIHTHFSKPLTWFSSSASYKYNLRVHSKITCLLRINSPINIISFGFPFCSANHHYILVYFNTQSFCKIFSKICTNRKRRNLVLGRTKQKLLPQCLHNRIFGCNFYLKWLKLQFVLAVREKKAKNKYDRWKSYRLTFTGFLKQALWSFRTWKPREQFVQLLNAI